MPQKSSSEIRNLKTRELKCWKVIDHHLRMDKSSTVTDKVRQAAAEFILKRLYPEKTIIQGDESVPIRVIFRAAPDPAKQ